MSTITYGLVPRETAAALSGLELLSRMIAGEFPAPPFAEVLKMRLVEVAHGRAVFEGDTDAAFYNPMGTVHGGWMSSVLDSALGCAVHTALPAGRAYTTVDLKTVFLRPLFGNSGTVRCEGTLAHMGGRIATADARLVDGAGKLIAQGTATCMILDATQARG